MSSKSVSAQNGAYSFVTDVATRLSNRLAHPTGASSSCDQEILKALRGFMESAYFARAHYNFNFQLTYPGLQVGRTSGCEQTCPASGPLAGLEAVSGNDTKCSRNSTTTSSSAAAATSSAAAASSSATTPTSSAAAASSSASLPPTWNTSCEASDVFSDISCDLSTREQCPMGIDGTQRCYLM